MRWILQLVLSAPAGPARISFEGLKREAVKAVGVSITSMTVKPWSIGFVLLAGASSRQVTMQFPILCNEKKILLKLILDLSKMPMENGSVPVKLGK
jgi:hypothetical protein